MLNATTQLYINKEKVSGYSKLRKYLYDNDIFNEAARITHRTPYELEQTLSNTSKLDFTINDMITLCVHFKLNPEVYFF